MKIGNKCLSRDIRKDLKKLLTSLKLSDKIRKSLKGDKNKQEITMKVVRKKMVFEN